MNTPVKVTIVPVANDVDKMQDNSMALTVTSMPTVTTSASNQTITQARSNNEGPSSAALGIVSDTSGPSGIINPSILDNVSQLLSLGQSQNQAGYVCSGYDKHVILQKIAEDIMKQGQQLVEQKQKSGDMTGQVSCQSEQTVYANSELSNSTMCPTESDQLTIDLSSDQQIVFEHLEHQQIKDANPNTVLPPIVISPELKSAKMDERDEQDQIGNMTTSVLDKIRSVLTSNVLLSNGMYPIALYSNPKTTKEQMVTSTSVITNFSNTADTVQQNAISLPLSNAVDQLQNKDQPVSQSIAVEASLPLPSQSSAMIPVHTPSLVPGQQVVYQLEGGSGVPHLPSYHEQTVAPQVLQIQETTAQQQPPEGSTMVNVLPAYSTETADASAPQNKTSVIELYLEPQDIITTSLDKPGQTYEVVEIAPTVTEDSSAVPSSVYCVDCNCMYTPSCPKHPGIQYTHIEDRPIESRAKMTLPQQLYFQDSSAVLTVFAKEEIPAKTLFGPLEGQMWSNDKADKILDTEYMWQLFQNSTPTLFVDCRSDDTSNWLKFVRRAWTSKEQNLVVYQQGLALYFVTKRAVSANEQLLYWYAADYANLLRMPSKPEDIGKCTLCDKQFHDQEALLRHQTQIHPTNQNRKYHCPVCQKGFTSRTKVDLHMTKHTGDRPFPCTVCSKSFTDKSNLRKHIKIHQDLKEYLCTDCGKSFRQRVHLDNHLAIHRGEKRLACSVCDKKFARTSDLKQHSYIHTKEHQYPCPVCQRSFHRKNNLKKHLEIHDIDRQKLPCTKCSKSFPSKYHLKRHLLRCKGKKAPVAQIRSETGAELGLSIAKKRIQKRDTCNQLSMRTRDNDDGS